VYLLLAPTDPWVGWILAAIVVCVCLTIGSKYIRSQRPWLRYVLKPLSTTLVIALVFIPPAPPANRYTTAIVLGLVFSLTGDIFILFPARHFLRALAFFLVAHLCYWSAFLPDAAGAMLPRLLFPMLIVGLVILFILLPGVPGALKVPVVLYAAVLVGTVTLAFSRHTHLGSLSSLHAASGAPLLLVSDAVLAVNRFQRSFRLAEVLILTTYYAGQVLLALSVRANLV